MKGTSIEWTDHTFNPWEGCAKVSPGCAHCYAEARNHRFGNDNWGKGKARRRTSEGNWKQPLRWNREWEASWRDYPDECSKCGRRLCGSVHNWVCPARYEDGVFVGDKVPPCGGRIVPNVRLRRPRVFCASLADWLDDEVPIEWLADLLRLIHETPNLDWLLLTKRPGNFLERVIAVHKALVRMPGNIPFSSMLVDWCGGVPPGNVWMGVSVEDQARADERVPVLLGIPARVRFLSVEPLLEAVDLTRIPFRKIDGSTGPENVLGDPVSPMARERYEAVKNIDVPHVHWVIVGGESGPKARPCKVGWVRGVVEQCKGSGVRVFVKQLGARPIGKYFPSMPTSIERDLHASGMVRDPKGGDWSEWPEDLRVREFPEDRR